MFTKLLLIFLSSRALTTFLQFFSLHHGLPRRAYWVVPPWLVGLLFNMIWEEEGKLEVEANLGKRLVSLDLDINFPDDFAAELALLCDIRRLKVGNEVNGRPGPAPADRVPARRKSAHIFALSAHTS